MTLRELIRAPKTLGKAGEWAVGKMPRAAFPLSKSGGKAYRLGNRSWRVVEFDAGGRKCRLLINHSQRLGQYQAMLGVEHGADTKVIASLEYHSTHGSWHVHGTCDRIQEVPAGIKRGPWNKRVPKARAFYRTRAFLIDDASALRRAVGFFGLGKILPEEDADRQGRLL